MIESNNPQQNKSRDDGIITGKAVDSQRIMSSCI